MRTIQIMSHPCALAVRVERELIDQIDQWRITLPGIPSRNEAIRRLLAVGVSTLIERKEENV